MKKRSNDAFMVLSENDTSKCIHADHQSATTCNLSMPEKLDEKGTVWLTCENVF